MLYEHELEKHGVKIISATEMITDTLEGNLLKGMIYNFAAFYSKELAVKVRRGMKENALKCKFNGGNMPMGYRKGNDRNYEIDPVTAPLVLEAFTMYDEGAMIHEIVDHMKAKGLTNGRGGAITFNVIHHLLHNRKYIGEFAYGDTIIADGIPAIVSKELFDRVQERLAKNKKAPARKKAKEEYLLITKVFCGKCGAMVFGESGTGRHGKTYRYYKCANAKNNRSCSKKPVPKELLEDLVIKSVMDILNDDAVIEGIVNMLLDFQERENTDLPLYEQQLKEVNASIQNVMRAIEMGILTSTTRDRLIALEQSRDELQIKILNEKNAKPKVDADFLRFWLHKFRTVDTQSLAVRKMLIDTFVNVIYLYDDKLVLTFNYRDSNKEISLAELDKLSAGTDSSMNCLVVPGVRNILFRTPFILSDEWAVPG